MSSSLMDEWLKPHKLTQIEDWVADGYSHERLADAIGITRQTFYNWLNKSEKLRAAVNEGKEYRLPRIKKAFRKICTGYYVTEEKMNAKGEVVQVKRYIEPSVPGIIFYLKNQDRENWKDKWTDDKNIDDEKLIKLMVVKNDLEE